jgi:hypothetical protein
VLLVSRVLSDLLAFRVRSVLPVLRVIRAQRRWFLGRLAQRETLVLSVLRVLSVRLVRIRLFPVLLVRSVPKVLSVLRVLIRMCLVRRVTLVLPVLMVLPDLRVRREILVIRALLVKMVLMVLPGRKASQVPQVLQVLPEKTA